MRIIAAILSLYVLMLAFVPCADELSADSSTDGLSLVQKDLHPEQGGTGDFCTPFCHCHCCHSHVTFMNMDWHSQPFPPFSEKNTPYIQQQEHQFPFSIFQPPRV